MTVLLYLHAQKCRQHYQWEIWANTARLHCDGCCAEWAPLYPSLPVSRCGAMTSQFLSPSLLLPFFSTHSFVPTCENTLKLSLFLCLAFVFLTFTTLWHVMLSLTVPSRTATQTLTHLFGDEFISYLNDMVRAYHLAYMLEGIASLITTYYGWITQTEVRNV